MLHPVGPVWSTKLYYPFFFAAKDGMQTTKTNDVQLGVSGGPGTIWPWIPLSKEKVKRNLVIYMPRSRKKNRHVVNQEVRVRPHCMFHLNC
jgi:hypothetical protein